MPSPPRPPDSAGGRRPPFTGIVLCGGASGRMGRDKATLTFADAALVAHPMGALRAAGADPVFAVGGDRIALADLGLSPVADRWPGAGPLGAVVTGLHATPTEVAVVLACDTPFVSASTVVRLAAAVVEAAADVAVAVAGGVPQPLVAAYHRRSLPALEAAFTHGERGVQRALDRLRVTAVASGAGEVRDLDTPADVQAALADLAGGAATLPLGQPDA